ncbi:hypothetical protein RRG08_012675 [Elysia crispata]|uniref:Uncharacterized protein n=1 Tax=Elysia crispata TaxID=231223 RepID=A0AAE0YN67_9GAST|nr:hypothetical protein RRG08_012675 [Elysia crispata]
METRTHVRCFITPVRADLRALFDQSVFYQIFPGQSGHVGNDSLDNFRKRLLSSEITAKGGLGMLKHPINVNQSVSLASVAFVSSFASGSRPA